MINVERCAAILTHLDGLTLEDFQWLLCAIGNRLSHLDQDATNYVDRARQALAQRLEARPSPAGG